MLNLSKFFRTDSKMKDPHKVFDTCFNNGQSFGEIIIGGFSHLSKKMIITILTIFFGTLLFLYGFFHFKHRQS